MSKTNFTVSEDQKTLIMERTFSAPKEKIWEAYTTAEVLEKWFGPIGWETEVKKMDFSEGGEWIYVMKCVDENQGEWFGQTSSGKAVFSNLKPFDSMDYIDYFTDDNGVINKELPSSKTTLTFTDNGDGTTTLSARTTYETPEALKQVLEMGMEDGYSQTLDRLEDLLNN